MDRHFYYRMSLSGAIPDDSLLVKALREALTDGIKDYTEQQMKATVARLLQTYDEWERIRKSKDSVQETRKEPRGNNARPLRDQVGSGPSHTDSSTSSEHLPTRQPRPRLCPANATFDATPSRMPTPQSATAKAKRPETALDRDNIRVDRILEGIPDIKALDKGRLEQLLTTEAGQVQLDFNVSPEEFEK